MAIKRYDASADNTITNSFKSDLTTRATGSNMGQSDILEVFSIFGQATSTSDELSRVIIDFPVTEITSDRSSGIIPASGSVNFFLKLYNAEHIHTLPRNYNIAVHGVSGSWQEGHGLDMDTYEDETKDYIGSNWINANGSGQAATATLDITNDITLTASTIGRSRNGNTFELQVVAAAANPTNTILVSFTGTSAAIVATVTPNNGDNNGSTAVNLTTAEFVELINNGSVDGKTVTITDSSSLRALQTASGGGAQNLANGGEGDDKTATFANGNGKWVSQGGDFYTDTSSSFEQTFQIGNEDLEVDVTPLVEQWLHSAGNILGKKEAHGFMIKLSSEYEASSSANPSGAIKNYYTKKFFGRGTNLFFKKPVIEARWDSSIKDDRGNFFFSSSLAPAGDNLNTIYLYNYIRGKLRNIPNTGRAATATLDITNDIILTASTIGTSRDTNTFELRVEAAAANPTNTILVSFTGTSAAIVATVTPNNGDNNGSTAVNLTTAEFVELINNGSVSGKTITITDSSSLRELQTATGGGAQNLADSGEGDNVTATFANGNNSGTIAVSLFSGSAGDSAPDEHALMLSRDDNNVKKENLFVATGSNVSTGIYKCTFAFTGAVGLETVYDVWFKPDISIINATASGDQYHTGSIKTNSFGASNFNPNRNYVVSMPYLKDVYSNKETERFRLYVREKNWSPNIYTVANSTPETLLIESASYQVTRVVDQKVVIPHGTGSGYNNSTMLSYDVSGNYFDLDMTMLEGGYTYGFQYSFYEDSVSSYRQQPYLFKFKVEKDEY